MLTIGPAISVTRNNLPDSRLGQPHGVVSKYLRRGKVEEENSCVFADLYDFFFNGRKRRIREGGAVSAGGNLLILHDRTVWRRIWAIERPGNKVSLYFFFLGVY